MAISSIKWSNPGTVLNRFFRHYKMEKNGLEWFLNDLSKYGFYFLFRHSVLYRGHVVGSYCRKAVDLVGVA